MATQSETECISRTLMKECGCYLKKELEFDIYSCEANHILIVERKESWGDHCMTEVACPFDKFIAEYRTTVKEPELPEAIQRFITERKGES